jgi:hypothetical protein
MHKYRFRDACVEDTAKKGVKGNVDPSGFLLYHQSQKRMLNYIFCFGSSSSFRMIYFIAIRIILICTLQALDDRPAPYYIPIRILLYHLFYNYSSVENAIIQPIERASYLIITVFILLGIV